MELSNQSQLAKGIIELSVSNEWGWAKTEWVLDHIYFDEHHDTCLCGHYPIREICVLRNTMNNNWATVGNVCVKRFMGINSERIFGMFRGISHNLSSSLGQKAITYAHNKGWINGWELEFYSDTVRKRKLSDRQLAKRIQINEKIRAKLLRTRLDQPT